MKQKCAKKAVEWIKDGMIVGLGGGSTIAYLIEEIREKRLSVFVVTPSMDTEELCAKYKIPVLKLESVERIDVAFDGCDEVDFNLNALKSCGGIHTREKLVAAMAKDYILLATEDKYEEKLTFSYPVTLEVIRSAKSYVKRQLTQLGAEVVERKSTAKMGLTITDDGNYLLEARFQKVENLEELHNKLSNIVGVVEHSLFYHVATKALIAGEDDVKLMERN